MKKQESLSRGGIYGLHCRDLPRSLFVCRQITGKEGQGVF
jgi:hypothetical protein